MTYEMFFDAVKALLWETLDDLPEYKLLEYMKSQENVKAMASGAAYSLYLLYEG